jgi:multiple sugar transport system substrate-binding protein
LPGTLLGLCGILLMLAGCATVDGWRSPATPEAAFAPSPTPTSPTLDTASPPTPEPATRPITLTLWLPPEMIWGTQGDLTNTSSDLGDAFVADHNHVQLEIVPKALTGPAGIIQSLLATQPVAPWRMPDLALVDTADLQRLVDHGIITPLTDLVPESTWEGFFPFALDAVTLNDQIMAIPFHADIQLLVYNAAMVETPPRTWVDLVQAEASHVLPLGRGDGSVADTILLHYIALHNDFDDDEPEMNVQSLAAVLAHYRQLVDDGVVPESARGLGSLAECWDVYFAGDAAMAHVSSVDYQQARPQLRRTQYAQIPTQSGRPITMSRSWAWVVLANNPQRQELALRLVDLALQEERYANWLVQSHHLPTQPRALAAVAVDDEPYRVFLEEQLSSSYPYPDSRVYPQIQDALARALDDVLDGVATPEQAATTAAAAISRLR